ncbi:MAG: ABC transporter permease [bacterium]
MSNVAALTRRELAAYFLSPIAYIVLTVFVLLPGYVLSEVLVRRVGAADLTPVLHLMGWLLLFLSPMLTMRLFADEFQSGTVEPLLTAPVTTLEVVVSKYLAALFVLAAALVPTFLYAAVLLGLGRPDPGPLVAGYFGLFLLGGYFLAVGMVASACVRTQIGAALVALVALLLLQSMGLVVPSDAVDPLSRTLRYVSYWNHFYEVFPRGILDTRDVVFFVSHSVFGVFLTAVIVSVRRWG